MSFWHVVLLFFGMAFGVGALAIFLEHLQKIAVIKAQARSQHDDEVRRRLEELARQVAEIRQMHTDHVLNLDSHLQHLEYKLSALESRLEQVEQAQQVHR
ncbi:MAG: hypothetical protein HPY54_08695 [Chthonomonadetes bacterium]|nr:hypothetical protein [Chthonomonadetes bacterium]